MKVFDYRHLPPSLLHKSAHSPSHITRRKSAYSPSHIPRQKSAYSPSHITSSSTVRCERLVCRGELSADAILDLDIFNLSERGSRGVKPAGAGAGATPATTPVPATATTATSDDDDDELDDSSALFWQPGKHGYYSPRAGRATPERLSAFRNIGRYVAPPVRPVTRS